MARKLLENMPETGLFTLSLGGNNDNGQIGGNCRLYIDSERNARGNLNSSSIMVDMGCMFDLSNNVIDEYVPDADAVLERPDHSAHAPEVKLDAMLLTHAHLDHTGAIVHYLNRGFKFPTVYAPKLTLETVRNQLEAQQLPEHLIREFFRNTVEIKDGDILNIGRFKVEAIANSHSFADTMSFKIESPNGKVLHTGDLNTDRSELMVGETTNFDRFEQLQNEDLDALLIDSTRATQEEEDISEAEVYNTLKRLAENNFADKKLVICAMGNMHHRLNTIARVAKETGRDLVLTGQAHIQTYNAMKASGYNLEKQYGFKFGTNGKRAPGNMIEIVSGTQGETEAVLTRGLLGVHKTFSINPKTDVLLMMASAIPGNENNINAMLSLAPEKLKIVTTKDIPTLHAGGHSKAFGLSKYQNSCKAKCVIPMHGNPEMIEAQCKLAEKNGYKSYAQTRNDGLLQISSEGVTKINERLDSWVAAIKHDQFNISEVEYRKNYSIHGMPLPEGNDYAQNVELIDRAVERTAKKSQNKEAKKQKQLLAQQRKLRRKHGQNL